MAGTIIVDRIESDASYASTINVANKITFSNTTTFRSNSTISTTAAESLRLHRSGSSSQISSLVMEDGGSSVGTANTVRLSTSLGALSISTGGTGGSSTGGTEYARVEANGVFNLVSGQLRFPATQSASSDPNTFDDYEEGTWTPTDLSGAGLTFQNLGSAYVKVGQMVLVQAYFNWPVTGNTTATQVGGLPFAVLNYNSYYYGPCRVQVPNVIATVQLNSDTNYFYFYTPSGNGIYTNAQLSGGYVLFSCCYQAKV